MKRWDTWGSQSPELGSLELVPRTRPLAAWMIAPLPLRPFQGERNCPEGDRESHKGLIWGQGLEKAMFPCPGHCEWTCRICRVVRWSGRPGCKPLLCRHFWSVVTELSEGPQSLKCLQFALPFLFLFIIL